MVHLRIFYCVLNHSTDQPINNILLEFSIDSINSITENSRELCLFFELKETISAEILNKNYFLIYRVQFITKPNNGVYESLTNSLMENFEFSDAYGNQL